MSFYIFYLYYVIIGWGIVCEILKIIVILVIVFVDIFWSLVESLFCLIFVWLFVFFCFKIWVEIIFIFLIKVLYVKL